MIPKKVFFLVLALGTGVLLQSQNLVRDSSFSFSNGTMSWKTLPNWRAVFTATPLRLEHQWTRQKLLEIDSNHVDAAMMMLIKDNSQSGAGLSTGCVVYSELEQELLKDSVYKIALKVLPGEFVGIYSFQVHVSNQEVLNFERIKFLPRTDLFLPDSTLIVNKLKSVHRRKRNDPFTSKGIWTGGYIIAKWAVQFENKWIEISGSYKAKGGEKFIYVGNVNEFAYRSYSGKIRNGHLVPCRKSKPACCPHSGMEIFIDDLVVRREG